MNIIKFIKATINAVSSIVSDDPTTPAARVLRYTFMTVTSVVLTYLVANFFFEAQSTAEYIAMVTAVYNLLSLALFVVFSKQINAWLNEDYNSKVRIILGRYLNSIVPSLFRPINVYTRA